MQEVVEFRESCNHSCMTENELKMKRIMTLIAAVALVGTLAARANNTTRSLLGIDVSHYDGSINWTSVYGDGVRWAYAKATEGTGLTDAYYNGNMNNGKA